MFQAKSLVHHDQRHRILPAYAQDGTILSGNLLYNTHYKAAR